MLSCLDGAQDLNFRTGKRVLVAPPTYCPETPVLELLPITESWHLDYLLGAKYSTPKGQVSKQQAA